ncbi:MAG: hypothetical protein ABFS86_21285, partial [Planctomycetota bacterium]
MRRRAERVLPFRIEHRAASRGGDEKLRPDGPGQRGGAVVSVAVVGQDQDVGGEVLARPQQAFDPVLFDVAREEDAEPGRPHAQDRGLLVARARDRSIRREDLDEGSVDPQDVPRRDRPRGTEVDDGEGAEEVRGAGGVVDVVVG